MATKMIGFRVRKEYEYTGNQVRSHVDNFFQWLVNDAKTLSKMEQYPEWDLVSAILGGWK
jgi:hypothetical protein